jgi:hypothetical protein
MRVLHEDLVGRIALLQQRLNPQTRSRRRQSTKKGSG